MSENNTGSPKVIVKYQGRVIKECAMNQERLTIGRKPDNDLVIDDAAASGHHALIEKIHAVYFLQDQKSTNGTYVNGHKVDRKQLNDADVVTIGKHRLVFMEERQAEAGFSPPHSEETDKTVFLKSGVHASPAGGRRKVGMVEVVAGRTDRTKYKLTKQLTIIGTQTDAVIKLTGFFAPKTAAMIGRRGQGYYLAVPDQTRKVLVNHIPINRQTTLKDGDLLEVAGVKMYFYLKDAA